MVSNNHNTNTLSELAKKLSELVGKDQVGSLDDQLLCLTASDVETLIDSIENNHTTPPETTKHIQDEVVAVIQKHPEIIWSTGSRGCRGCSEKYDFLPEDWDGNKELVIEYRRKQSELSFGWSHEEWCAHVAEHLAEAGLLKE